MERSIDPDAICWPVGSNLVAKTSPEWPKASSVRRVPPRKGQPTCKFHNRSLQTTGSQDLASSSISLPSSLGSAGGAAFLAGKGFHTDCTRAPFCALFPTTAIAEPLLRLASDFCRFTTSCCDELKLSEAVLLETGIMVGLYRNLGVWAVARFQNVGQLQICCRKFKCLRIFPPGNIQLKCRVSNRPRAVVHWRTSTKAEYMSKASNR